MIILLATYAGAHSKGGECSAINWIALGVFAIWLVFLVVGLFRGTR